MKSNYHYVNQIIRVKWKTTSQMLYTCEVVHNCKVLPSMYKNNVYIQKNSFTRMTPIYNPDQLRV
jgi:hypothetical protein